MMAYHNADVHTPDGVGVVWGHDPDGLWVVWLRQPVVGLAFNGRIGHYSEEKLIPAEVTHARPQPRGRLPRQDEVLDLQLGGESRQAQTGEQAL